LVQYSQLGLCRLGLVRNLVPLRSQLLRPPIRSFPFCLGSASTLPNLG
jgi:hypothetical protein